MKNFQPYCGAQGLGAVLAVIVGVVIGFAPPVVAETLLQRDTYLMKSIVACGNCHTPKGPKGDLPGMELAGLAPLEKTPAFTADAPNITLDKQTGSGDWTDAQIILASARPSGPTARSSARPCPSALTAACRTARQEP